MKVECTQTSDSRGERARGSRWYTVGKTYDVLAVTVTEKAGVLLRLIGDEPNTPALYSLSDFKIVDGRLSSNWVIVAIEDGFELSPRPWVENGFWERFFDQDRDAVDSFNRERSIILGSE